MKNKKKYVMIDIETFGIGFNSAIVAIGAVLFNPKTGKVKKTFYRSISLTSSMKAGLDIDPATLLFWMKQSDDARKEIYNASDELIDVLKEFSDWLPENVVPIGNSASFDLGILGNAYDKVGIERPWKFWNEFCYRTLKNIYPKVKLKRIGTYHNALDDALSQVDHFHRIYKKGNFTL